MLLVLTLVLGSLISLALNSSQLSKYMHYFKKNIDQGENYVWPLSTKNTSISNEDNNIQHIEITVPLSANELTVPRSYLTNVKQQMLSKKMAESQKGALLLIFSMID